MQRLTVKFVPTKTADQLNLQALHRAGGSGKLTFSQTGSGM
jgi:hypothetical protein